MDDQLKKTWKNIVGFWKNLSKKSKTLIISGAVGIVVICIVLSIVLNRSDYTVLFSGLEDKEATEVMAKLKEKSIEYKCNADGTISVPTENESDVRMQLSQEGYPRTGFNYDIFKNNIDFMTTDFEKREYAKFQTQDRIMAAIETITGVKKAIVNIALPENNSYAWDDNKEVATAAVKINMLPGYDLTNSQVNGIKKLVSTSVTGLTEDNVSITDINGNELSEDSNVNKTSTFKLKLEIEKQIQDEVVKNVKKLLSKAYREKNIEVSSKCVVNLDKKISENLQYMPEGDSKKGVIHKEDKKNEAVGEGKVVGGIVGTETNSEAPTYPEVEIKGDNIYYKDNSTIDYLVSQLKQQVQHDSGSIEKLTVAVVINREKLSDDEKQSLRELVSKAAGVELDDVAIHNIKFDEPIIPTIVDENGVFRQLSDKEKIIIGAIAGGVLILIIIILVVISKIRKRKRKKMEEELETVVSEENSESWKNLKDEIEGNETKEAALKKQIAEFSSTNPEIAAQLIRTWMKGE